MTTRTNESPAPQADNDELRMLRERRSFVRGMCPSKRDYTEWCAEVDRLLPPGGGA